ncbi:MAG: UDP-N-acetylglucosamine 1-carboxyvinyltransferase [Desulfovibrionaceae bacterium]
MEQLVIEGGKQLFGDITISGSKNSTLPILFASILLDGTATLYNIPHLKDCITSFELLKILGCNVSAFHNNSVSIQPQLLHYQAPYDLVRTMRASILCLGPLLARLGKAKIALPGGCAIGSRPVALHLDALEKMGVTYQLEEGYILASCKKLHGADITFSFPTVGGTENVMMAATLAEGETILRNAAKEPEIVDLANFLISCGALIEGHGSNTIKIEGVTSLTSTQHTIMPDRMEAGTFMVAAAITRGSITLHSCPMDSLEAVINTLSDMGVVFSIKEYSPDLQGGSTVSVSTKGDILATAIKTLPHPRFPTDMQAQTMALMSIAKGTSTVEETIFENRFMHVPELVRMGANITISGNHAVIKGINLLRGAPVMASDLRASASLVLAGLCAAGVTQIQRIYHLDRGYESIEKKLSAVGAHISRERVK